MTAFSMINPDFLDSARNLAWEAAYEAAYDEAFTPLVRIRDAMKGAAEAMKFAEAAGIAPAGYDADPELVKAWAEMDPSAAADAYATQVAEAL